MWKELIKQFEPQAIFAPGVTESQLAELETQLSLVLPEDLKTMLQESNGVIGAYGLHLLWSTEEIVLQHRLRRTHPAYKDFQPVDDLLFFADAGNGDCFAFPLLQGKAQETVVVWNHESQSREAVATSLQDYLERWLSGKIRI